MHLSSFGSVEGIKFTILLKKFDVEILPGTKTKYEIHLGNCEWLTFDSLYQANKFKREYKKLITFNLRSLNNFHAQIYSLYRTFYFDLDNTTLRRVKSALFGGNEVFDKIFGKYSEGNHNAFVLKDIDLSFHLNLDALYHLIEFARCYKNYSLKNQSSALHLLLLHLEDKYQKDKRNLLPTIPKPTLNLVKPLQSNAS